VNRGFIEGPSWLLAHVGRGVPVRRVSERHAGVTYSRVRVIPSDALELRPTVYLPSSGGTDSRQEKRL
jgi:hypothetical protein